MKRTTLIAVSIPALIFVFAVGQSRGQDMPPTLVVTDTVQTLDFHEQITLVGRTEANIQSEIVAEVSGQVAAIDAGQGVWINRGDVLISLDAEAYRLSSESKDAEAEEARVTAELAESNWIRAKDLFEKKLVREATRDSVRAWATISAARAKRLAAERDQAARDYRNCRIKAPFSGYTGRRLVSIGEWVDPGTPVFEMVDLSQLLIMVDLPERHFGRLSLGSPATIIASGDKSRPFEGTITGFSPRASDETHTYPVIITAANPDNRLGGGALVRATLSMDQMFTSLAVNKDAIVRQGPQTMIYSIHDGQAAPIPVLVTANQGAMSAIAGEGLVQGMPVIVRGNERVFPGAPVRTAGGPTPGGPPEGEASAGEMPEGEQAEEAPSEGATTP